MLCFVADVAELITPSVTCSILFQVILNSSKLYECVPFCFYCCFVVEHYIFFSFLSFLVMLNSSKGYIFCIVSDAVDYF